jgi:hypothetical protein
MFSKIRYLTKTNLLKLPIWKKVQKTLQADLDKKVTETNLLLMDLMV